jgi:hypothetical protein
METKMASASKDTPTSQEKREFWKEWRKRYRLTASGTSLEEIGKGVKEEHKTAWKTFTSLIILILGTIIFFTADILLFHIFKVTFLTKPKKRKPNKRPQLSV